ncbi:myrosinase 1 [Bombyx mori]|uniref:myrosinase 1 n=1 Tax=Bombyx mori TaxID=7091 RepID=UPI002ED6524F
MLVVSYVLCFSSFLHPLLANKELHFPRWFKFGAATSSYQIEGSWNVSDKTPSIWDHYTHTQPHRIKDHSNGDVACDSYNQYEKDIEMAEQLGLDFYRFSISWPRLLPEGYRTRISSDGRQYYDNLINGLLDRGIEPMVTLYHSDMPKIFQDLGGWANPEMAQWFADYADVVFSLFGDRVKLWITFNEPLVACDSSLQTLGVVEPFLAPYLCTKTVLMAHAKAYHNYKDNYKPMYQGISLFTRSFASLLIGLCLIRGKYLQKDKRHVLFCTTIISESSAPFDGSSQNIRIPVTVSEITGRKFIGNRQTPIHVFGKVSIAHVAFYFGAETQDDAELAELYRQYNFGRFMHPIYSKSGGWPATVVELMKNISSVEGFPRSRLPPLTKHEVEFIRGEFLIYRVSSPKGSVLNRFHLAGPILLCIYEDGARIHGYTYWSLMDNFEWLYGYTSKFGLYDVDFSDEGRKRTPRLSAQYYSYVIKSRSIDSNKWKSQMEDTNDNKKPIDDVA